MTYKVKKNNAIIEDLELLDDDTGSSLIIHVELKPMSIATEFRKANLELINAQKALDANAEDKIEKFAVAVSTMFNVIFGESNAEQIISYFDHDYMEAAVQIMPFIAEKISPAIAMYAQSRKEIIANNYDLNRRQKRKLGL